MVVGVCVGADVAVGKDVDVAEGADTGEGVTVLGKCEVIVSGTVVNNNVGVISS